MTGNDIINEIGLFLHESLASLGSLQNQKYASHVRRIASEIAVATKSVYRHAAIAIVPSETTYELPYAPIEVRGVNIIDPSGQMRKLTRITATKAQTLFNDFATTNPSDYGGVPEYYLIEAYTNIKLFPVANYAAPLGLIVSAYWSVDSWLQMSDPLPIPAYTHSALSNGVGWYRCREMLGTDAVYATNLPLYQKDYQEALAGFIVGTKASTFALRGGPPPVNGVPYGTLSSPWNWIQ